MVNVMAGILFFDFIVLVLVWFGWIESCFLHPTMDTGYRIQS